MATTSSPWGKTGINRRGKYLDILNIRPVPADPDDVVYENTSTVSSTPRLISIRHVRQSKIMVGIRTTQHGHSKRPSI